MKEKYAFPSGPHLDPEDPYRSVHYKGISERNYMALKIMCALISNPSRLGMYSRREDAAKDAYHWADALIAYSYISSADYEPYGKINNKDLNSKPINPEA